MEQFSTPAKLPKSKMKATKPLKKRRTLPAKKIEEQEPAETEEEEPDEDGEEEEPEPPPDKAPKKQVVRAKSHKSPSRKIPDQLPETGLTSRRRTKSCKLHSQLK